MDSPAVVQNFLQLKLAGLQHEVFAVMLLDTRLGLIAYEELFSGTIDQTAVYPREVVKLALLHNASAVILAHNHPSRSPEPSRADIVLTGRLKDALQLVDVRVLDHVIVAGHAVISFAQAGLL